MASRVLSPYDDQALSSALPAFSLLFAESFAAAAWFRVCLWLSFDNPWSSGPFILTVRTTSQLISLSFAVLFRRAVQALDALKVLPLLDPVLISGQEGIEKPAAAIYLRACARARVGPTETLHVGDELQA